MKLLYCFAAAALLLFAGCKKDKFKTDTEGGDGKISPVSVRLPDSTLFVGTYIADSPAVYLLNASTGSLVHRYIYKGVGNGYHNALIPFAGNGLLYTAEVNKINAINPNTGALLWTDTLNSAFSYRPILHNTVFYGVCTNAVSSNGKVYALDATKKSDSFLWEYSLPNTMSIPVNEDYITYYNNLIYLRESNVLTVLDATTGTVKYKLNSSCSLSSLKNDIIIAGNNLLDAATGNPIATVPLSLLPATATQSSSVLYANKQLYFISVATYAIIYSTTRQLNAYDIATHTLKWSADGGKSVYPDQITKTVDRILDNQVIVKTSITTINGKYSPAYKNQYSALDINTGQMQWMYDAGYQGQTFALPNNMQYSNGTFYLNFGSPMPMYTSIVAANLKTGAIKWRNDKIYISVNSTNAICLYTGGKGYSAYTQ